MRVFLRLLGVAMIISAAVLFFWQDIREIFTDRVNDRIIEAYQNGESSVDVGGFEWRDTGISTEAGDDDTEEAREGINIGEGMTGVLKIDSAGINEPVFEGPVTEEKMRSEEHTCELQSRFDLVCRLLLEEKKTVGEVAYSGRVERKE